MHHIPNGIDAGCFAPAQRKSRRLKILILNRNFQDPHKGFQFVQEALNLLESADVELTLAGSNSGWAIARLKGRYETRDLGYISDRRTIAELYAESHLFLFASPRREFSVHDPGGDGFRLLCRGDTQWRRGRADHGR